MERQFKAGVPGFLGRVRLAHLGRRNLRCSVGSCSMSSQISGVSNTKNSTTESQPLHSSGGGPTIHVAEKSAGENNVSREIGTTDGVFPAVNCLPFSTFSSWSMSIH